MGAQVDVADVCIKEKLQLKTGTSIDSTAYLFEKIDLRMLDSFSIVFWGHVPIGFARKIGSNMVVLSGYDLAGTIQHPASSIPSQAHVGLDDGSFQSGLER